MIRALAPLQLKRLRLTGIHYLPPEDFGTLASVLPMLEEVTLTGPVALVGCMALVRMPRLACLRLYLEWSGEYGSDWVCKATLYGVLLALCAFTPQMVELAILLPSSELQCDVGWPNRMLDAVYAAVADVRENLPRYDKPSGLIQIRVHDI